MAEYLKLAQVACYYLLSDYYENYFPLYIA